MSRLRTLLPLAVLAALCGTAVEAKAAAIAETLTITGFADGQVGGTFHNGSYVGATALSNTAFTLTATTDPMHPVSSGAGPAYQLTSLQVSLGGIGVANIGIPFAVFVGHGAASLFFDSTDGSNDAIGFRSVIPAAGPPALATWDAQSSLTGVGIIEEALQIGVYGLDTSLGKLDVTSLAGTVLSAAPTRATSVPEPASWPLLAAATLSVAALLRRARV